MTTGLFAQGPGGFGGRGSRNGGTMDGGSSTPATPEELATLEVNSISMALRLSTTQTSAMQTDLACASGATTVIATMPCALTAVQNVLQANAANLKTGWASVTTALTSTPPGSTTETLSTINALQLSDLEARVAGAGAVLAELGGLKATLTAAQQTNLINLLVGGGGFRR